MVAKAMAPLRKGTCSCTAPLDFVLVEAGEAAEVLEADVGEVVPELELLLLLVPVNVRVVRKK